MASKKYRQEHPEQILQYNENYRAENRARIKKNARKKRNVSRVTAINSYKKWSVKDIELIHAVGRPPDDVLAVWLGRTFGAIQTRRRFDEQH